MTHYLVTTNLGNLWYISNSSKIKLLENKEKSIFTNDSSFRFIKPIINGCIVGVSEELLFFQTKYKPEIIKRFSLPGLVDIKDIAVFNSGKSVAILSGLRDSVYILRGDFQEIQTCFNINKDGKLEFFRERQSQCQEINSNYFQIFYCPEMNNYHRFNRLKLLNDSTLLLISDNNMLSYSVSLKDFKCELYSYNIGMYNKPELSWIKSGLENEIVIDYIEC